MSGYPPAANPAPGGQNAGVPASMLGGAMPSGTGAGLAPNPAGGTEAGMQQMMQQMTMMQQMAGQMAMMQQHAQQPQQMGVPSGAGMQLQQQQMMLQAMQQQMQQVASVGGGPQAQQMLAMQQNFAAQQQHLQGQMPPQQPQTQTAALQQPQSQTASPEDPAPSADARDYPALFRKCIDSLSDIEREYFTFLWDQTGHENGALQGKAAFDFLCKSRLPKDALKRMWEIVDWQKRFFLMWPEFVAFMKLVYAAQKKQLWSLERLEISSPASMDCPEFDGIDTVQTLLAKKAPVQDVSETKPVASAFGAFDDLAGEFATGGMVPPAPLSALGAGHANSGSASIPPVGGVAGWGGMPSTGLATGDAEVAFGVAPALAVASGGNSSAPAATTDCDDFGVPQQQAAPSFPSSALPRSPQNRTAASGGNSPASISKIDSDDFGDFAASHQQAAPSFPSSALPRSPQNRTVVSGGNSPARSARIDSDDFGDFATSHQQAANPHSPQPPDLIPAPPGTTSPSQSASGVGSPSSPKVVRSGDATGDSNWNAFGSDQTFAAAATFTGPSEAVPTLQGSAAPTGGDTSWADFGDVEFSSAPVAATSAPQPELPGTAAANTGPGGPVDQWSKMSAFDDLLREDDLLEEKPPKLETEFVPGSPKSAPGNQVTDLGSGSGEIHFAPSSPKSASGLGSFTFDPSSPKSATGTGDLLNSDLAFLPGSPKAVGSADLGKCAGANVGFTNFGDFSSNTGFVTANAGNSNAVEPGGSTDEWADFAGADFASAAPASLDNPAAIFPTSGFSFDASAIAASIQATADTEKVKSNEVKDVTAAPPAEDWAAFGFEEPAATVSGTCALSPARPKGRDSPFPPESPAASVLSFAALPSASAPSWVCAAEGTPANEFVRLARQLAENGFFDEANRCTNHAAACRRVDEAETQKAEAVAKDNFEGAIEARKQIQRLGEALASTTEVDNWRKLASDDAASRGPDAETEQLSRRCQCLDGAFDRKALAVALTNFRRVCPTRGESVDPLADLPIMLTRQRVSRQMSRAIDTVSSTNVLRFLQVLMVSLNAMTDVLASCAENLLSLTGPDWDPEERALVLDNSEFKDFLRGLVILRRLLWRFGFVADLFLPHGCGASPADSGGEELSEAGTRCLDELHTKTSRCIDSARAAWVAVESGLKGLAVSIQDWEPQRCLEAGGDQPQNAGAVAAVPLCNFCLLPAQPPLSLDSTGDAYDGGAKSVLWKGRVCHVQCTNFWVRHSSTCKAWSSLGIRDPFGDSLTERVFDASRS